MTISELDAVGQGGKVMYRGMPVTYEYLTMRFVPFALGDSNRRKQPMKASIRHWDGRSIIVHLKSLFPIPATSAETQ